MSQEPPRQPDLFQVAELPGRPMLHWHGKRPLREVPYYPAQLRERYGPAQGQGWVNRLYWGDNLQVMAHLLREFRGQVKLIYIDPPFDSGADYRRRVKLHGTSVQSDLGVLEERQYTDIWSNDLYLQYMYERLILMRELLVEDGTLFLHCDQNRVHHLRCLLDEVFGETNFCNEIIWQHQIMGGSHGKRFSKAHETILWYAKGQSYRLREDDPNVRVPYSEYVRSSMKQDEQGRWYYTRRRMSRKATAEELAAKAHTITYVDNRMLPEVVYHYPLADSIQDGHLKEVRFYDYARVKSEEFVRDVVDRFWEAYGEERREGLLPKMAIYCATIRELEDEFRPLLERVLVDRGLSAGKVLVNHSEVDDDAIRRFRELDTPDSPYQFILLVGKGTEGWNCRSLFATALYRRPHSRVFLLQSSMRCLRSIGDMPQTASIFLSTENRQVLEREIQANLGTSMEALQRQRNRRTVTINVLKAKKVRLKIEYWDDQAGCWRKYFPDFFLRLADDGWMVIEVKRQDQVEHPNVQAKDAAARAVFETLNGILYHVKPDDEIRRGEIYDLFSAVAPPA